MINLFKKVNITKLLVTLTIIFLIITLAVFPDKYSKTTYDGVVLWAISVMPSLLPYFFLTAILTKLNVLTNVLDKFTPLTKKVFHLQGISFYAFFMSILSGYPVGSKLTADLYENGLIDKAESFKLGLLCSTSGPLFIIGAVGTNMFLSKKAGFILYITHVLSALLTAFIFRGKTKPKFNNNLFIPAKKCDNILYESIYSSVISVLVVGGFVSVFYVISQILLDLNVLYPLTFLIETLLFPLKISTNQSVAFSVGLIEFTKGAKLLSNLGLTAVNLSLTNFLITFGGVSVIMQSLAFLKKTGVKTGAFIFGKLIQAVISTLLSYISLIIFL